MPMSREETKTSGEVSYLQNKEKNIAELKKKLNEVKAHFWMPEDRKPKKGSQEPVSRKNKGRCEEVVRCESQRMKGSKM